MVVYFELSGLYGIFTSANNDLQEYQRKKEQIHNKLSKPTLFAKIKIKEITDVVTWGALKTTGSLACSVH